MEFSVQEFLLFSYGITLLILCPLIFLAAFIDSIAGGGGLISLPAYLFVGIPIHTAYGTNKFSSTMGTLMAMGNYFRKGYVDYSAALSGGIAAFFGSLAGTFLALSLSPYVLQISLMIILPLVAIFMFTRQSLKKIFSINISIFSGINVQDNLRLKIILCSLIGLVLGTYDGFFGPGTGMFITILLNSIIKLNLIKSAGTARVINFSSNIASMTTWLVNGKILFPVAIPCMISAILGGFIGSRLAIKIGSKFIRIVLAIVASLLFIRVLTDIINF